MIDKLIIATTNKHKLIEIEAIFKETKISAMPANSYPKTSPASALCARRARTCSSLTAANSAAPEASR